MRGLLVTLAVIVVLFHTAGGWYYSGRIQSDALAVRAYPVVRDLTVTRVEGSRITLADPGPQNILLRSRKVYGVVWPGGYGRVSGPPSVSGDDVTRTWRVLRGHDADARHEGLARRVRLAAGTAGRRAAGALPVGTG